MCHCVFVFFHYRLTTQLNKKNVYFSYFFHIINNKQFSSLNERAVCVGAALERENSRLKRVKDWKYLWNGKFLILRECFFFDESSEIAIFQLSRRINTSPDDDDEKLFIEYIYADWSLSEISAYARECSISLIVSSLSTRLNNTRNKIKNDMRKTARALLPCEA